MSTLSSRRYRVNSTTTLNKRLKTSIAQQNVMRLINRNKFRRNNKLFQSSSSIWDISSKSNNSCGTIDRYKQLRWKVFLVRAQLPDGSSREV
jgi:hypothetical protein